MAHPDGALALYVGELDLGQVVSTESEPDPEARLADQATQTEFIGLQSTGGSAAAIPTEIELKKNDSDKVATVTVQPAHIQLEVKDQGSVGVESKKSLPRKKLAAASPAKEKTPEVPAPPPAETMAEEPDPGKEAARHKAAKRQQAAADELDGKLLRVHQPILACGPARALRGPRSKLA